MNSSQPVKVSLDDETSNDMSLIMKENEASINSEHPEGSFLHVFWQQQKEAVAKPARGRRWHPMMVKWCIYLRHQSSKAYDTLRDSGCIQLPSKRTLRDYTNCVKAAAGFSNDVDRLLMQAATLDTCEDWKKLVMLLLDEMHIKEDLVYDKHTGAMIGFVELGDINEHLLKFERQVKGNTDEEPLANSMMVMMVRGIFTTLRFAYVQFPCASITGNLLFHPFWEAVYRLERMGLKVHNCTVRFMYSS